MASSLHFFTPDQLNFYFALVSSSQSSCLFADYISAVTLVNRPSQRLELSFLPFPPYHLLWYSGCLPQDLDIRTHPERTDILLYILCMAWFSISSSLTALYNRLLKTSTFPSEWKRALIRPFSKIRAPLSPSNTRPIANLPKISKIFKKIVALQIMNYLNKHNLLNPRQSAYCSNHNIQSVLLRVYNIKKGIDN